MITKSMSNEERLAYCQSVIQSQKESGLSITRWCRESGIPKPRFYRYLHKCREAAGEETAAAKKEKTPEGGVYQLPELAAVGEKEQVIVLEAGGVKVEISREADWEKACAVLRALQ